MDERARWYILQTHSGHENAVASNIIKVLGNRKLEDEVLEIEIPTRKIIELKNGKKKEVIKKIYPGYVLIKMHLNDRIWHTIRSVRGVVCFAGGSGKPIPLDPKEELKLGVKSKSEIVKVEVPYKVSDSVKIIDGPLEGHIGVITEINMSKEQAKLDVIIFSREVSVEVNFDSIIPLE